MTLISGCVRGGMMLCGWLSQDVPRWLFHTVGRVNSPLRRRVRPLQRALVLVRVFFFPQTAGGARVRSRQHEHFSLLTPPLVLLYVLATVTSTARTAAPASRAESSWEGRHSRHSERISRACVRGRGSGVRAVYTGWVGVEGGGRRVICWRGASRVAALGRARSEPRVVWLGPGAGGPRGRGGVRLGGGQGRVGGRAGSGGWGAWVGGVRVARQRVRARVRGIVWRGV